MYRTEEHLHNSLKSVHMCVISFELHNKLHETGSIPFFQRLKMGSRSHGF